MARNGIGTMNLVTGNPVVTGTQITTTWVNTTMSDIAAEVTNSVPRDGQAAPLANLPMGGFQHTGATAATAAGQYTTFDQLADVTLATRGAGQIGFLYSLNYVAGTLGRWSQDLALPTGSQFIGCTQTATGAVLRTVQSKMRDVVSVRDFGVAGDGVTDDTAALNAVGALGIPIYIPYTATGYKITGTVTFSCDVVCDGILMPTVAVGANTPSVVIAPSAYGVKRTISRLVVAGSSALRTALVNGIRVDCANCLMDRCSAYTFNYNWIVRMYSVTLRSCNGYLGNYNLSAYARTTSTEINAFTLHGGNWDSAVTAAVVIGDTSWGDAMAAGVNQHGVNILIDGTPNFDGSEVRIDNVFGVRINGYWEGTGTAQQAIRLGGSGDGNCRNIEIMAGCYFSTMPFAVKCYSGVAGLTVRPCFYTAVLKSALYVNSDLYPFRYEQGISSGSFAQGQEVHTGFRSLPLASITFGNVTIPHHGISGGSQIVPAGVNNTGPNPGFLWYPGATLSTTQPTVGRMNASSAGRFYSTPALLKSGSVSGGVFTFTTLADCYAFNGGDQIATAPAGATYIRSVDYVAGTIVIDGGSTAAGAATVSQQAAAFRSDTTTYSGSPPTAGAWVRGDACVNAVPAAGSPKGWRCTVSGTPGTWLSEGNL